MIVEDTAGNCLYNRGNAVIVPTFDASEAAAATDDELHKLMQYLEVEVLPAADVRRRHPWHPACGQSPEAAGAAVFRPPERHIQA